MKTYPKILIISHNLYDISNNIGKTLVSLLNGWPQDKVSQIYLRNDSPSFKYSNDYYCITDKSVLKSIFSFRHILAGKVVQYSHNNEISQAEKSLYNIGNHRIPLISLIRDLLWYTGVWKTHNLKKWLIDINPQIILFAPNDYWLAYDIALYAHSILKIPVIPFYMDDTFYYNVQTGIIDRFRRNILYHKAIKINEIANVIFTINDYMSEEYAQLFKKACYAFVNSVPVSSHDYKDSCQDYYTVSYLGNLHSNRWQSICEIGKVLDEIAVKHNVEIVFNIYTLSYIENKVKDRFSSIKSIQLRGGVTSEKVREIQCESDVLIHVEAFDQKSINSTRLSLSTKIPEYLSTGVPVFAYGPSQIASMRYLHDNNLSCVCYEYNDLTEKLQLILFDNAYRKYISVNGMKQVKKFHDINTVSQKFQELIKNNIK